MLIILYASVIVVIIYMIINFIDKYKNKRFYTLMKQFHSYPTYPLIGNLNMLYGSLTDLLENIEKIMLPDRVMFFLGPIPVLLLKKYDDIVAVSTQTHYRDLLGFGEEWLGIGLINAKYEEWKISKRVLAPAFNTEMLTKYANIFKKKSLDLVDALKPSAESGEIRDVWEDVMKTHIDTAIEVAIGAPVLGIEKTEKEDFSDAVLEGVQSVVKQAVTPWLYPRFMYHAYLKLTGRIKYLHRYNAFITKILQAKLNEQKNGENSSEHDHSSKSIVDLLIKASVSESSLTDTRIRDEFTNMLVAAIETTGLNTCFSMLMLAIHQDIQQKVYEEVEELFKDKDTPTADDLFNGLKYMEQCIKETSRIFTHVILTFRRTHRECTLKDGTIIPANTMVLPLLFLANRDSDLYENPQKWDPQHFSEDAVKNRPKKSFMSFGYGPRSCMGIRYAMLSIKTELAYILHNYKLSTNIKELTTQHLKADLCIRSTIGYPIKFTKRNGTSES